MKVIIFKTNEVKDVAFGHAANFLIPQGLAVKATEKKLAQLKIQKEEELKKQAAMEAQNKLIASQLNNKKITLLVKTSKNNKIFGTVTKKEILQALNLPKGQAQVILDKPIKKIGKYEVEIKMGKERVKINLEISNS